MSEGREDEGVGSGWTLENAGFAGTVMQSPVTDVELIDGGNAGVVVVNGAKHDQSAQHDGREEKRWQR